MSENKIVYYSVYCQRCKHSKLSEHDEPCNECLSNPVNEYSHKPVKYEDKFDDIQKEHRTKNN